jgi:hypothetical protein
VKCPNPYALGDLDMARFTRQFPPVLDTLMKNILDILYVYEQQRVDEVGGGGVDCPLARVCVQLAACVRSRARAQLATCACS